MESYFQKHLQLLLILIPFSLCAPIINSLPFFQPTMRNPFSPNRANHRKLYDGVYEYFYNQTMDHFSYRPESYITFRQKYVVIDDFWGGAKNNAPLFVFLGAEEDIETSLTFVGFPQEIARYCNALIVYIEHRYYGLSNPKGSMSKSLKDRESLGYFNSAQALADYAEIIQHLNQRYKAKHSPVFVFGVSYGGMLATWFRLKYPHLAMGALASSAPIFQTTVPSGTYDNWVNKMYRVTSKTCYETIARSWGEMMRLSLKSNGLVKLSKKFNTCSTLNKIEDLGIYLRDMYRSIAQYDIPSQYPLSSICRSIDRATNATDLDRVVAVASQYVNSNGCIDVFNSSSDETTLGWDWQACSEMMQPWGTTLNFSITNSIVPVNPFDLETYIKRCNAKFGVPPRPSWVSTYYGAQDLRLVLKRFGSNIIFSNGLKDPYSQEG